jgi:hypothetical protein
MFQKKSSHICPSKSGKIASLTLPSEIGDVSLFKLPIAFCLLLSDFLMGWSQWLIDKASLM